MKHIPTTFPSPATGRPLSTVNQIHYALKTGAVFCELANGSIKQVYQARRRGLVFQVRLENNQWEASPRRVWAEKATKEATRSTAPTDMILITRTPVGDRSLDELQALAFLEPLWLEATPDSRWVIIPQWGRRGLALKNWSQERPVAKATTFAELVALMRKQMETNELLDQDENAPLRSWQIATPMVSTL